MRSSRIELLATAGELADFSPVVSPFSSPPAEDQAPVRVLLLLRSLIGSIGGLLLVVVVRIFCVTTVRKGSSKWLKVEQANKIGLKSSSLQFSSESSSRTGVAVRITSESKINPRSPLRSVKKLLFANIIAKSYKVARPDFYICELIVSEMEMEWNRSE